MSFFASLNFFFLISQILYWNILYASQAVKFFINKFLLKRLLLLLKRSVQSVWWRHTQVSPQMCNPRLKEWRVKGRDRSGARQGHLTIADWCKGSETHWIAGCCCLFAWFTHSNRNINDWLCQGKEGQALFAVICFTVFFYSMHIGALNNNLIRCS